MRHGAARGRANQSHEKKRYAKAMIHDRNLLSWREWFSRRVFLADSTLSVWKFIAARHQAQPWSSTSGNYLGIPDQTSTSLSQQASVEEWNVMNRRPDVTNWIVKGIKGRVISSYFVDIRLRFSMDLRKSAIGRRRP